MTATLLEIERRGWDSLCSGTGGDFYGALMTADAVMVVANGAVMDRDAVIESLEHAPPWRTYSIDDARLIRSGSECFVLVYRGTAFRGGRRAGIRRHMSSVYRRMDGGWRLALYQQTPMPPTE